MWLSNLLAGGTPQKLAKEAQREVRTATHRIRIDLATLDQQRNHYIAQAQTALAAGRKYEATLIARQILILDDRVMGMIQTISRLEHVVTAAEAGLSTLASLGAVEKGARAAAHISSRVNGRAALNTIKHLHTTKANTDRDADLVNDAIDMYATPDHRDEEEEEGDADDTAEAALLRSIAPERYMPMPCVPVTKLPKSKLGAYR